MDPLALWGIILITGALLFYSIGVWGEFFKKNLLRIHVVFFWSGLLFDTIGTTLMIFMAEGIKLDLHSVSGAMAILLMLGHAIWATIVERSGTVIQKAQFHKYSLFVWLFWLIPFFYPTTGMG